MVRDHRVNQPLYHGSVNIKGHNGVPCLCISGRTDTWLFPQVELLILWQPVFEVIDAHLDRLGVPNRAQMASQLCPMRVRLINRRLQLTRPPFSPRGSAPCMIHQTAGYGRRMSGGLAGVVARFPSSRLHLGGTWRG